jgi:hypothetical protein
VAVRTKQLWILCAVLWGPACTADVYVPVSHPTPLLKEAGDLNAGVYTSTNGTDLHTAYAFFDHFGVGSNLNYMYRDFEIEDDFQKHKYGEISLIYFVDLQDTQFRGLGTLGDPVYSNPEQEFKLEFLGSIGLGEGEELRNSGEGEFPEENFAKGRYSKYSLQSNAAIETDVLTIGVSPKLSYISYHDFITSGNITERQMTDKTDGVFWEPAFFLGAHYKDFRLESQIGISRILGSQPAFSYERFYFSVGVQVNLNVLN